MKIQTNLSKPVYWIIALVVFTQIAIGVFCSQPQYEDNEAYINCIDNAYTDTQCDSCDSLRP